MRSRLALILCMAVAALSLGVRPALADTQASCTEASLDAAVAAGGTVTFNCTGTITLTHTITVSGTVTIDGGDAITIDGDNAVEMFAVPSGATLTLSHLTLAHGYYTYNGGAVTNQGTLTLDHVNAHGNNVTFPYGGGAVMNQGVLLVESSTFSSNTASSGGAIDSEHTGTATITDSTFTGNSAASNGSGGAIFDNGPMSIVNGTFTGNTARIGGAIASGGYTPTLTISGSSFSGNSATYSGGAMSVDAALTMTNSQFTDNTSAGDSGAICNCGQGGSANITGSTFTGNQAAGNGGAIVSYDAPITVGQSTFDSNTSGNSGGAIQANNSVTVSQSDFLNNSSTYTGGAIFSNPGPLTVSDTEFDTNSGNVGGAIWTHGTVSINRVTFDHNTATAQAYGGGAMFFDYGGGTISNSTFYANSAYAGGGIFDFETPDGLTLNSDTLANNSATTTGGNLYLSTSYHSAVVTVENSIVTGGSAQSASDANCAQSFLPLSGGYNIETGNTCGFAAPTDRNDALPSDVALQSLANNGGFVQTMALGAGSIAIDTGEILNCPATDARGAMRPAAGSPLSTPRCDVGAYEYRAIPAINSLSPDSAPAGSASIQLQVTGTNFINGSTVRWNGSDLATTFNSSTLLIATVPASDLVQNGTASVSVHNPGPGDGDSGTLTFTITNAQASAPPVTQAIVSPQANSAGWQSSPVTVTLTATDQSGQGIAHTYYGVNAPLCGPSNTAACQVYSAPLKLTTDGVYTITYFSTDNAGNAESAHTLTVKLDTTPPSITFTGNAGTYTIDQQVNISCNVQDTLSGVATSTCPSVHAAAYTLGPGSHTLDASATDNAGNSTSTSTTYTVTVTAASLEALTQQFMSDANIPPARRIIATRIEQMLNTDLERAGAALAANNRPLATRYIRAYQAELRVAQALGLLTPSQAATLSQFASAL